MVSEEFDIHIDRIIASKSFGNSTTYANLLRYLAQCTLAADIPKETTIASEIFARKDFDPSQSTLVRVYAYNLRKKLDAYYKKEGASDKKRIRIPKGSYAVELVDQAKERSKETPFPDRKWGIPLLAASLIALLSVFYLSFVRQNRPMVNKNGLWKDLIASERPKMLLLGDLFIYNEIDTALSLERTIRDPEINSREEFEAFRFGTARTNRTLEPLSYTHLILGSVQWIKKLTEIFYSIGDDYAIRTMSRFNPKELQDYDIMVVGMHKTLGVFKTFPNTSAFRYDVKDDAYLFRENPDSKAVVYRPEGDADSYHTDYAIMTKVPGPNGNTIYIFSGIWDTGATQSLKNFTEVKLLAEVEAQMLHKFGTLPQYYEILFEVNGIDRMELSSKILYMNRLEDFDQP